MSELEDILKGIDLTESDADYGWWETTAGSSFGENIKRQVIKLFCEKEARIARLEQAAELFEQAAAEPCYCADAEYGCPQCDLAIKAQNIVNESPQQSTTHIQAEAVDDFVVNCAELTGLEPDAYHRAMAKDYAQHLRDNAKQIIGD